MANDELVFVCLQCGHGCASYEDLTSHMEDHEDRKPDIRQLRKTTMFNKNKYGGKLGKNSKKNHAEEVCSLFICFLNSYRRINKHREGSPAAGADS